MEFSDQQVLLVYRLVVVVWHLKRIFIHIFQIEPLLKQSIKAEIADREALAKLKLKKVGAGDPLGRIRNIPGANTESQWECDICRMSLFYSRVS